MQTLIVPILLFALGATGLCVGLLVVGRLLGPRRSGRVKEMPYESGMDPIHDTRRRFDVRYHLVAIAFLIFDVELLFLYPWAVASHAKGPDGSKAGIDMAVAKGWVGGAEDWVSGRGLVFAEVMVFIALLTAGFIYAWRKGVFQWR